MKAKVDVPEKTNANDRKENDEKIKSSQNGDRYFYLSS